VREQFAAQQRQQFRGLSRPSLNSCSHSRFHARFYKKLQEKVAEPGHNARIETALWRAPQGEEGNDEAASF
jgi:hypothetical protein